MFVACRQKEKKMSWSSDGSHAVSAVRMGFRHGVIDNFIKKHEVDIANIVPNQILKSCLVIFLNRSVYRTDLKDSSALPYQST